MTKRVLVLNPYLPTLGGGEKHMGYLCKFIESYYEDVTIDIMVHNYNNVNIHSIDYPTINDLEERFGIRLEKTKILKMDLPPANTLTSHYKNKRYIERITKKYDLFINFMFLSKHVGKAEKNIYFCMFPPQKYKFSKFPQNIIGSSLDFQFKNSYDYFITNSLFTNHWQQHYWDTGKKNKPIYPPVFSETEMVKADLSKKENVILSVGRFFVGAHNKKQDTLVDFFIANHTMFEGWELHLVGALSNNPHDVDYVKSIKNKIKDYPVHLHINIPLVEVDELYSKAKLFWHATGLDEESDMFPDKMEHFGITTVEAMSNGVVPIVINKGGQTEIVNHRKDGFLWNSREELLEYSLELISDSNKREILALQAIERAEFFSVENFYKHNEEIFNAL
ncbi:glycosyltransferase family 4 protein [Paenibacillus sp. S150]|uniref:glycosyltransferase family 4 protein n=1 Tax=Paenibacillus sp. S150 TaxID=2749826 RepID=UPI001C56ED0A|nr:glycosyltransferase family 4 protein [Paenibacillus sp. S150]MBW4081590.1 glycosyltransferase family 4 protein [Paenibacillus sp. S150]